MRRFLGDEELAVLDAPFPRFQVVRHVRKEFEHVVRHRIGHSEIVAEEQKHQIVVDIERLLADNRHAFIHKRPVVEEDDELPRIVKR